MKHPMKYRLALLFGLIATGIEASDAAEWTGTIDRYANVTDETRIDGEIAATNEALWIGPDRAFDPATGADLSPYALPERMSLVDMQYGISSQRGQLWKTYQFFDDLTYYQPDAVAGFWGTSGTAATTLVHLAEDGAQKRKWTAADLGHPEMHVIASRPLPEGPGALVLIGNGDAKLALGVDYSGRVVRSNDVPACSFSVSGDRQGGFVAYCPAIGGRPAEMKAFDRQGILRFTFPADAVVAIDDGFWFLNRTQARMTRVDFDGRILAAFDAPDIEWFASHHRGNLIAWRWLDAHPQKKQFQIISGTGVVLREIADTASITRTTSIVSMTRGSSVASILSGDNTELIDDNGQSVSAPIPYRSSRAGAVMADARTVCREDWQQDIVLLPYVGCFDRLTGQALFDIYRLGDESLKSVDGDIVIEIDGYRILERDGTMKRHISSEGALALDFHPKQGFVVLRSGIGPTGPRILERYRADGSPLFSSLVPADIIDALVAVGSDGSTIVAGKSSPTSLLRYDVEGNLRAMRTLDLSQPGTPLVAASSSSNGVLLLQRRSDDRSAYSGQVTMLDAQLVRRGDYAFAGALDAQFQSARDGAARFVHTSPSGLMVLQFDPASGQPSERRALPIQNTDGRFAIDLDGVVRAMSFDAALGRDVLRISRPASNTFTGPIRQSALAGAWFNPASTGQGLLLQLLNGDVLFGAWHTFAPEGGNALSKQQWFTVSGKVTNERGRITMPIYRNAQGRFDTDGVTPAVAVGSAELVFTGCDQMEFWYRIGDDAGAFPMQRLTPRTQTCDDGTTTQPAADAPKGLAIDGAWLDPAQSGQGFTINTTGARFGSFLAGWFTYDTDNGVDDAAAQHWFTLQGATPERYGQSVPVFIHRTTGGSRAGTPTLNSHQVGSALLTIDDCAHATLDYAFDDSVIAGPFADRARRIQLSRLGACPQ